MEKKLSLFMLLTKNKKNRFQFTITKIGITSSSAFLTGRQKIPFTSSKQIKFYNWWCNQISGKIWRKRDSNAEKGSLLNACDWSWVQKRLRRDDWASFQELTIEKLCPRCHDGSSEIESWWIRSKSIKHGCHDGSKVFNAKTLITEIVYPW